MGNITTMAVFVWTLNILIFLAQASMINMNSDSIMFYDSTGTPLAEYSVGGGVSMPNSQAVSTELNPESSSELQESASGTGIFFIDGI